MYDYTDKELKRVLSNLKHYREANEENGVVTVPLFIIDDTISIINEHLALNTTLLTEYRDILGNHSSRFELKSKDWILTDDDSCQYRREAVELEKDSGKVFELYQIQAVAASSDPDPAIYKIAHDYVYLNEVDVDSVLECYGYESLDNLKSTYPDNWEAILAESQFELDADSMENLFERTALLTWQKAKKMIETMIQRRG